MYARSTVFLLALLTAGFAEGQPHSSAEGLLAEVSERYRQAESFHFEAAETTSTHAGDLNREQELHWVTAQDSTGRWRVEMGSAADTMLAVFDGHFHWTYRPGAATYTKQEQGREGSESEGASPLGSFKDSFVSRYGSLTARMKTARVLGEETLTVAQESVPCVIVEAEYAAPAGSGAEVLRRAFWVDPGRYVIWREESEARIGPAAEQTVVRQNMSFHVARMDEPLPDELFLFTPPAGVRQVESLRGEAEQEPGLIGQPAPLFNAADLEGNPFRLTALRGQVVLLNFWATWCIPCRLELPRIEALHRSAEEQDLVVLGVNSESGEVAIEFVRQQGYTFPTLADSNKVISRVYGVDSIPTTVGIDKEGNVAFYLVGEQSENELRDALAEAGLGLAAP